ncbi:energy-coupling factor ABC transporter ATP-binding protein [Inmirania thermothiophila]|uniref:Tungstate transport system ATP-binding protein n=1 Tax=Inmirania thermothiophila TaxID=1750597 RepID=A0A3N1Y198_9GAMM|nr:energy-coupling factor ABC transporter ATP-binding protein [Inmirania thermothiophila]ROR32321.1 tungstate transport system ATP-binding protein [Inmirania thermothiophila]
MSGLELRGLRLRLHGRLLLDIERLQLERGACLYLSGANGAGKTTLLRILAGLLPPDEGLLLADGASLRWPRAAARLRRDVVYCHQAPYLFRGTVADNVAYGLRRQGVPAPEVAARVAEALAWAGIAHLAGRDARRLSGGEQQRVALTRARVLAPRYLLLDEPTANLDGEAREQTYFLLRRLRLEGIGLVVTSHEPRAVSRLADRHLLLEGGRLRELPLQGPRSGPGLARPGGGP